MHLKTVYLDYSISTTFVYHENHQRNGYAIITPIFKKGDKRPQKLQRHECAAHFKTKLKLYSKKFLMEPNMDSEVEDQE
jgi:hypothetical protein